MKTYKTEKILNFSGGLIGLSRDQARVRSHLLEKVEKGVYNIIGKLTLKAGERIGLVNPDKAMLCFLFDEEVGDGADVRSNKVEKDKFDMELVISSMFDLEEGNLDHFTQKGLPRVGAVAKLAGCGITSEQCHEAWAEFQKV